MNKALSIFNQLRPMTVGFDNIFDHFERLFDNDFTPSTYPFYDIVKSGENKYDVEVALAGFNKDNITCEYADGLLTIKSKEVKDVKKDNEDILHKGISRRYFSKSFTISDDVEVKGATFKDGLLKVSMEKIVPESKKPKTITIR
jgi:molecular chaperone IbpA